MIEYHPKTTSYNSIGFVKGQELIFAVESSDTVVLVESVDRRVSARTTGACVRVCVCSFRRGRRSRVEKERVRSNDDDDDNQEQQRIS